MRVQLRGPRRDGLRVEGGRGGAWACRGRFASGDVPAGLNIAAAMWDTLVPSPTRRRVVPVRAVSSLSGRGWRELLLVRPPRLALSISSCDFDSCACSCLFQSFFWVFRYSSLLCCWWLLMGPCGWAVPVVSGAVVCYGRLPRRWRLAVADARLDRPDVRALCVACAEPARLDAPVGRARPAPSTSPPRRALSLRVFLLREPLSPAGLVSV